MNYIASRRDELNQENMNGEITDNQFLQEIKYLKSYDSVKEQADILSEGVQEKIEEISQDEHEAKAKDRRAVYHVLANSALALAGVAFVDHYRKKYSRLNNKSCKSDFNDNIKLVNGVDSNDQMFLDL